MCGLLASRILARTITLMFINRPTRCLGIAQGLWKGRRVLQQQIAFEFGVGGGEVTELGLGHPAAVQTWPAVPGYTPVQSSLGQSTSLGLPERRQPLLVDLPLPEKGRIKMSWTSKASKEEGFWTPL